MVAFISSWIGRLLYSLPLASSYSLQTGGNITSDSYFYGQSPPVYPSPQGTGDGPWAGAYTKARSLVGKLTADEKVSLTAGTKAETGCMGNIPAIPRVGFPGFCLSDASNGLRDTDYVNGWSSGIHVGASWNKELARDRGRWMAEEYRAKGVHVLLGPVVGAMGRVVEGGRNWEGVSPDPYLSGVLGAESVQGIQSTGVAACIKHFVGNEQELHRNPIVDKEGNYVESLSSNIDDKTLHELYMWPFQDAVRAGTVSVMCSYNRLNNSYACQNSKLLNGYLKEEMGFQGYVMSDWFAQHGGIAAANAGLDMALPISHFWGSNLTDAIANGTMNATRLDDMATRILASWYMLGQDTSFPAPGIGMPYNVNAPHNRIDATFPGAKETLLKSAAEGQVLVKNSRDSLPLKSPRMVSVFGYDAKSPDKLVFNTGLVDLNHSISADLGVLPLIQQNHTLWVGGGSGDNSPAYVDAPINALQRRAQQDGSSLLWDLESQGPAVNPTSDACLVFINAFASEAYDRQSVTDEYSDTLVTNVADKCSNTIVIVHNAGIRLVNDWIDHENVTGLVFAHLPGQDTGRAIVDLLYGDINPSGRLPYTVARAAEDYGHLLHVSKRQGKFWRFPQSKFVEGVNIDYRAFDAHGIEPLYEFGFGLSYTTFQYTDLLISQHDDSPFPFPPAARIEQGGNPHLWDEVAVVSATVTNTGRIDGSEVAQLYIGLPGGPVRQLRGFEKVYIPASEQVQVAFPLTRRDLSVWDVARQEWWLQRGDYKIYVGRSSRDISLQGSIQII
ncbi:hypothetical protein ASPSYDRAFT_1170419 [Aspergillus sydowii CBS 593.65]|uniref:Probable beta-glucosidase M n=1 Tax=Aspergillus sydowii CBS 593.65 TaxID=1036612 RepID=A0A1L9SYI7_9EURO|nr:uncharacterized protein ASPSYDRAFT_1170419 [Aspergillus sydowii CBS 593.65]OJJ52197.1 hypothetical protein ASPSYDRAFT_1170419 [Aspergillus sydowii CBS 593.65]